MSYFFMPPRRAIIRKDVEILVSSNSASENTIWCRRFEKQSGNSSKTSTLPGMMANANDPSA
jgi:hypothetical protein